MPVDGLGRHHQFGGGDTVGLPGREKPQHLKFTRGQVVRGRHRVVQMFEPLQIRHRTEFGEHAPRRFQFELGSVLIIRRSAREPDNTRTRAASCGASSSRQVCQAIHSVSRASTLLPEASITAPRAWPVIACNATVPNVSAMPLSSSAAPPAAEISPAASLISTAAGSSAERDSRSDVSASTRSMVVRAASTLPSASRSSGKPGCGS